MSWIVVDGRNDDECYIACVDNCSPPIADELLQTWFHDVSMLMRSGTFLKQSELVLN